MKVPVIKILHREHRRLELSLFKRCRFAIITSLLIGAAVLTTPRVSTAEGDKAEGSFFNLTATAANGESVSFERYRNKVILAVNVHLKCGTTPQLLALQDTYSKYRVRGFEVLAFPSEDFGEMDQKTGDEIAAVCSKAFHTEFPVFSAMRITGPQRHPVFTFLTQTGAEYSREEVGFNFEKFLVGRDGRVKARFGTFTGAGSLVLTEAIEEQLAVNATAPAVTATAGERR